MANKLGVVEILKNYGISIYDSNLMKINVLVFLNSSKVNYLYRKYGVVLRGGITRSESGTA